ncbi:hypothetical protein VN97_g8636 [Penicillium thymicola]|uniref:Uncharacterized protein n=1 Tax=Penicillium thymicola TaxID=293382 RepID=A0AAI9TCP6_PENTH|nr:hypothetical protein VN97_g8636 [Penicillium thymicola]
MLSLGSGMLGYGAKKEGLLAEFSLSLYSLSEARNWQLLLSSFSVFATATYFFTLRAYIGTKRNRKAK